jgi:hypothetical protein
VKFYPATQAVWLWILLLHIFPWIHTEAALITEHYLNFDFDLVSDGCCLQVNWIKPRL